MANEIARHDELDLGIEVSDITMLMMALMGLALVSSAAAPSQTAQVLSAMAYQGKSDNREVVASDKLQWLDLVHQYPHTPWMIASFINDGPDAVEIAINYPNDRFVLDINETKAVNRSGARERIAIVFFICKSGETAHVRVSGEY